MIDVRKTVAEQVGGMFLHNIEQAVEIANLKASVAELEGQVAELKKPKDESPRSDERA